MLFNSLQFILFFPIVTLLYFFIPHRYRWLLLLLASCIFYMAFIPAYILILLITIVVDYAMGVLIEKETQPRKRKFFLIISIICNVAFLAFFKYYNFVVSNLLTITRIFHYNDFFPLLHIILPIGLSFHTFQAMSYTIEVYRGNQTAERHLGIYALYVMFYPQLVAGPIERPQNLLHQFYEVHTFDSKRVVEGLQRMLMGFLKKVVIADRLAIIVNLVFNSVRNFSGIPLIIATLAFAFQIYYDFSSYSDIALGSAQVMGFTLMENFNYPYISKSISEFWRRWHISLSSWLRDYIYIPLGGGKKYVTQMRWVVNTMIVFLISGLWHGASWNFIIWGGLHGLYLVVHDVTAPLRSAFLRVTKLGQQVRLHRLVQSGTTFCLVAYAWIWFRAPTMSDAVYITTHLFSGNYNFFRTLPNEGPGLSKIDLFLASFFICVFALVNFYKRRPESKIQLLFKQSTWFKWALCYSALFTILIFGVFIDASKFIYFQF